MDDKTRIVKEVLERIMNVFSCKNLKERKFFAKKKI